MIKYILNFFLLLLLIQLSFAVGFHSADEIVSGNFTGTYDFSDATIIGLGGSGAGVPLGTIVAFNSVNCPSGWELANGSGSKPDLRGVFIRGMDNGAGVDTGRSFGSYQADDFKSHNHNIPGMYPGADVGTRLWSFYAVGQDASGAHDRLTFTTGGTETRPKNVALTYCIKTGDDSTYAGAWSKDATNIYPSENQDVLMPNNYGIKFKGSSMGDDATKIYTTSTQNRLFVRAEDTNNVAQFATYGMYLPQDVATGLYVRGGARINYYDDGKEFVVTNTGNVGIGTPSPGQNLEIYKDDADGVIRFHDPDNAWYSLGLDVSDARKFKLNYGSTVGAANHFTMDISGNIGIGTNTPGAKLDVAGTIRAQQICDEGGTNCKDISLGWNTGDYAIQMGAQNDLTTRVSKSGFYQTDTATTGENWPTTGSWYHLINTQHSNTANNYALQIAGGFFDQDLYYRKTAGVGTTSWKKIATEGLQDSGCGTYYLPVWGLNIDSCDKGPSNFPTAYADCLKRGGILPTFNHYFRFTTFNGNLRYFWTSTARSSEQAVARLTTSGTYVGSSWDDVLANNPNVYWRCMG